MHNGLYSRFTQAALSSNLGSVVIFSLEIFFSEDISHYYLVCGQYRDQRKVRNTTLHKLGY